MPMSNSQVRVIDPVLSSIVRGYKHPANVGTEALFPFVDTPKRGGTRIEFGKEDFMAVETKRAPGARVAQVQFGHAGQTFSLEDHALAAKLPQEHIQEGAGQPSAAQMGRAAGSVMAIMMLNLERAQAALATNAALYAASNKVTLAGTDQWSDPTGSDPKDDIETAKEAIRAKIGMYPNTMVVSPTVMRSLRVHSKIIEAVKYSSFGVPSDEQIRQFFDVQRFFVGGSVTASQAGTFSDVWGKFVILAYVEPNPSDMGMPSYGYTYRLAGHPSASEQWYDKDYKSWMSDVEFSRSPEIVGVDSGYLISAAVA